MRWNLRSFSAKTNGGGNFDVWIRVKGINEAGERFASQLSTAMITLVTAVSSFYFASKQQGSLGVPGISNDEANGLKVVEVPPDNGDMAKI